MVNRDLQLGDQKVTLNHLVYVFYRIDFSDVFSPARARDETNGEYSQDFLLFSQRFRDRKGLLKVLLEVFVHDGKRNILLISTIWVFPKIGVPQNGWFICGKPY